MNDSIFALFSIVQILGGLGIFHFGLKLLGGSLERLFGEKLQRSLETSASSLLKAIAAGALMAALTQSSSATMTLIVGFVAAGILPLSQAFGLVIGANIGTTLTAQLVSFGVAAPTAEWQIFFSPSLFFYFLLAAALVGMLFIRKKKIRTGCEALFGLGLLFLGMDIMEGSIGVLSLLVDLSVFDMLLSVHSLAMVLGVVLSLVLRSSTLSIALLQAYAAASQLPLAPALYIVIGINIGAAFSSLIDTRRSSTGARRAAALHGFFNIAGCILWGLLTLGAGSAFGSLLAAETSRASVALLHTLFNLVTALLLLPVRKLLFRLIDRLYPLQPEDILRGGTEELLDMLDPRFLTSPVIALEQCRKVVRIMGRRAFSNVRMATSGIVDHTQLDHDIFVDNEAFLDTCEARINTYLLGLRDVTLSDSCQRAYLEIQQAVSEFEQIGDYAENLHERYDHIREENISFSPEAVCEIGIMSNALEEMSTLTLESFENSDGTLSDCIEALEEVIDILKETLKNKHIQRLQQGLCTVTNGIPFLDIIHDLEKIADHCSNISIYVLMYDDGVTSFDLHEYHRMADEAIENHSQQWQEHYEERYLRPILGMTKAVDNREEA